MEIRLLIHAGEVVVSFGHSCAFVSFTAAEAHDIARQIEAMASAVDGSTPAPDTKTN